MPRLHGLWVMTPSGVGVVYSESPEWVVVHLVNPDGTTKMASAEETRSGFAAVSVIVPFSNSVDIRPATFAEIPRLRCPSARRAQALGICVTEKELADEIELDRLGAGMSIAPGDIGTLER